MLPFVADEPAPMPPEGRIPAARYVSREYATLEWERMWTRVWLLFGHASRVARPGDFATLDVGPESVLVTRGDDDSVRAFFNVCQHRGTLLCPERAGSSRAFRCRYHGWKWGLDGQLLEAPGGADFASGRERLAEIACTVRFGFVWISFAADPEPIDDFLEPLRELLHRFRPEELSLEEERAVAVDCNWKTSVDVHNEAYHIPALHPELAGVVDVNAIRIEILDRHSAIRVPLGAGEKVQLYVFPNVQLNFSEDALELYRHFPAPKDPERAWFEEHRYSRRGAREPRRLVLEQDSRELGEVLGRDIAMLSPLQRGLASRGFAGLLLGPGEASISNMHRTLDRYLGETDDGR